MRLRISARQSDLSRIQAYTVGRRLREAHPQLKIEYLFKKSLGDQKIDEPLWQMPEKGVFTEDFYNDLISDETDIVVHSWKDLPIQEKEKTTIVATLQRADSRDIFLFKKTSVERVRQSHELRVFSSSPRRIYNLKSFLSEYLPFEIHSVHFESVRGNVPTRIKKLIENTDIDGLVVAKAALDRLLGETSEEFEPLQRQLRESLNQCQWTIIPLSLNPCAAAQGALAIEILKNRTDLFQLLEKINDPDSFETVQKERQIFASYGGGCHQKIGVSILKRSYGLICYARGQMDNETIILQNTLISSQDPSESQKNDMVSTHKKLLCLKSSDVFEKIPLLPPPLPTNIQALYVSHSDAWHPNFSAFQGVVWTAGLVTWKHLVKLGIWVNGTSDSLGEQEDPLLDNLCGKPLKWAKLSHDQFPSQSLLIPTYQLRPQKTFLNFDNVTHFYWRSSSLFLHVIHLHPEILDLHHACGPGHTYETIRDHLEKQCSNGSTRLKIYFSEKEWKKVHEAVL